MMVGYGEGDELGMCLGSDHLAVLPGRVNQLINN